MVQKMRGELERSLQGGPLLQRPLRLGTDCSGAEAPVFALEEIAKALCDAGLPIHIEHVFSCDVAPEARKFIKQNCSPQVLFADLLRRRLVGHCIKNERPMATP